MPSIPDNVRQTLVTLVPASLINEISCFVFYDHHPRDEKNIDVTVCTFRGEVKEFHQRELASSVVIEKYSAPGDIRILRNIKCELFYLVTFGDEVIVLSGRNKLQIQHRIQNVDRYEIEDSMCRGQSYLKIVCKDDAVPMVLDDNLDIFKEQSLLLYKENSVNSTPILTQLARKLTESKYSVKCNKKVLKDLVNLRQLATYSNCKEACSSADAIFQENKGSPPIALSIKSQKPWTRMCNKKLLAVLEVTNKGNEPIQDVHVLLRNEQQQSSVYTTKIFERVLSSPYWKEKHSILEKDKSVAVVLVIDLKELQPNATGRIDINGAISYKFKSKDYLIVFEKISLSSLDIMGESFDVLHKIQKEGTKYDILSMLAASENTELCLRHIKRHEDCDLNLLDSFCTYLNMERVKDTKNMVVHAKSPYHILHGLLVILESGELSNDKWKISLFSRSQAQILGFIHIMHDAIPYRIIATMVSQKIIAKQPNLSQYNEDIFSPSAKLNYTSLAQSLMNQASITLQYLDDCMIKMNDSKDPKVLSKIGSEIDVFAGGNIAFKEFKSKILEEEQKLQNESKQVKQEQAQLEGMIIEIDD